MKLTALLLSLCISLNVLAASGTVSELERQMDEYEYVLAVEWDQKDQKFYQEQTAVFMEKLETLVKDQGLSESDIITLAEKRQVSRQTIEAIKLKLAMAGKIQSGEQLAAILRQTSEEMFPRGAAWNGMSTDTILYGLLIVGVIGYIIWFDANYKCVAWGEKYECDTTHSSDGLRSTTTCGWKSYCASYEKR